MSEGIAPPSFSVLQKRCKVLVPPVTQPPTVVCMEAQLEYLYTCVQVFARFVPICMLSRCLSTRFLHRSSVGKFIKGALLVGGPSLAPHHTVFPAFDVRCLLACLPSPQRVLEKEEEFKRAKNGVGEGGG